jgi:hypothetical protein
MSVNRRRKDLDKTIAYTATAVGDSGGSVLAPQSREHFNTFYKTIFCVQPKVLEIKKRNHTPIAAQPLS